MVSEQLPPFTDIFHFQATLPVTIAVKKHCELWVSDPNKKNGTYPLLHSAIFCLDKASVPRP